MTQRLYYLDSDLCDFEASVVERAYDGKRIYLDRSAFYPTSGSQPHDTGTIEGIEVADVVDEGERIAHLLAQPLSGVRRSGGTMEELRGLAQAFATLPQAVFIGAVQSPASILLSAAADSGINAGGVLKGVLAIAGGRGGGSAALAQGILPGAEHLDQVIAMLGGTNEGGPA